MNCNICGKEFDKRELIQKTSESGAEYCICKSCEENGIEIKETREYFVCRQCGYPHQSDEIKRACKFCGHLKDFEKIELTAVEEEMLDTEPQKLYSEKIGEDATKRIADWIESPQRQEVGIRHKRDRLIDTATLVGLILTYFLLEYNRSNFWGQKNICLTLMVIAFLVLITSPLFKKIDKSKIKKRLPIWSIYAIMAFFTAIYVLVIKLFS